MQNKPFSKRSLYLMLFCFVLVSAFIISCGGGDDDDDDGGYNSPYNNGDDGNGSSYSGDDNSDSGSGSCNADYSSKQIRCSLDCRKENVRDLYDLNELVSSCCDSESLSDCTSHLSLLAARDEMEANDNACYLDLKRGLGDADSALADCYFDCSGDTRPDDQCSDYTSCLREADNYENAGPCFDFTCDYYHGDPEIVTSDLAHELGVHYNCDCDGSMRSFTNDVYMNRITEQEALETLSCHLACISNGCNE